MGYWINLVRVDLHLEFSFFSFQRLPLVYFNFKLPQHYLKSWIIFQRVLPQCSSSATALDLIFERILQTGSSFLLIPLLQHQKISVTWRLAWVSQVSHGKVSICQYRRHQRCRFSSKIGKIFWKTKWQHATIFLAGESHWKRSLAGYSLEVAKTRTPVGWLSVHAALVMNTGDSLFPAQPLSYILCPWVLGTELSVWPSFSPSGGGSLTVWYQDDFSVLLQGERTFSFALPQVTVSFHLYVIYGWWCLFLSP